jgi:hypothetical protein
MIPQTEQYFIGDDDPILVAAFKRQGLRLDPKRGWVRPQEDVTASWTTPADAQAWAVASGACQNKYEASNSWLKIVRQFGSFGRHNKNTAFQAFFERQCEKLQAA